MDEIADQWTCEDTEVGRITFAVTEAILANLASRKGLDDALGSIDFGTYVEMMHDLHKDVWETLVKECGLDPQH